MRTKEETREAIEKLKENKEYCSKYNCFNEDNHVRIDIMIDTIRNERDEQYVYENYQSEFPDGREDTIGHGNWQAGIIALEYLRGKVEIEQMLYP